MLFSARFNARHILFDLKSKKLKGLFFPVKNFVVSMIRNYHLQTFFCNKTILSFVVNK